MSSTDKELARIITLATRYREAAEQLHDLQAQRDEAIVDAIDRHRYQQKTVAAAAGLSRARIIAILANSPIQEVI